MSHRPSRFYFLRLFCLSLGLMCGAYVAPAQRTKPEPEPETTASPTPAPTPKSMVSGRLVFADTERPVRRVQVTLMSLAGGSGESWAATDEQGYFRFKNVAAGSYIIAASAPGLVNPTAYVNYQTEKPNQEPDWSEARKHFESITVDGDNNVEVNKVRVERGGAVSGKVTYDNGDPALNVQVTLARKQPDGKIVPVFTSLGLASFAKLRTDDRGQYRIPGLPPGEYLVSATEANTNPDQSGEGEDRYSNELFVNDALARTYYGDTTDAKQATAVKVELGQEATGLDIRLIDTPLRTISGTLIARRDGRPVLNTGLRLIPKEKSYNTPFGNAERYAQVDGEGAWSFRNVPDGVYYVIAEPPYEETPNQHGDGPRYRRSLVRKQVEVNLLGSDQTGVTIQLTDGGSISGVVLVEGKPRKTEEYFGVCVRAEKLKDTSGIWNPWDLSGCAEENRKITVEGVPGGEFRLSASAPEGFYVKSITAKGADLTKQTLTLAEGEEIRDLRVVVAPGAAKLTLRALGQDGKPLRTAPVVLVPADPFRIDDVNGYLRGTTDAQGVWTQDCVPGEYLVFVPTFEDAPKFSDPDYVKQNLARAQRVTLQPNDRKTVEVNAGR